MDVCDARALAGPDCEAEAVRKLGQLAFFPVSVELLQSAGKGAVKQVSVQQQFQKPQCYVPAWLGFNHMAQVQTPLL